MIPKRKFQLPSLPRTIGFLTIALIVIRPHPITLPPVLQTYLADALLFILFVILASLHRLHVSRRDLPLVTPTIIVLISVSLAALIATLVTTWGGATPGLGVLLTPLRYLYYALMCWVFLNLLRTGALSYETLIRDLNVMFCIVSAIAIIQIFNPPYIGSFVYSVWNDDKLRTIWMGNPRIYATFYNANWFAVYLMFMASLWSAQLVYSRITGHAYAFFIGAAAALLIASGSRTGLIGFAIIITASLFRPMRFLRLRFATTIMAGTLMLMLLIGALSNTPLLDRTVARFTTFLSALTNTEELSSIESVAGRTSYWWESIEYIAKRPVFGYGVNEIRDGFIPHNSTLSVLLASGFIGLAAIGLFLLTTIALILFVRAGTNTQRLVQSWFATFTLGLLIVSQTADFINTTQIVLLWLLCAASAYSIVKGHQRELRKASLVLDMEQTSSLADVSLSGD